MTSKSELQKEISDLGNDLAGLEKRYQELGDNLKQTDAEIDTLNQKVGKALLDNQDASKHYEAIMKAKTKRDGLVEASQQAVKRLADLRAQIAQKREELMMIDFSRVEVEVRKAFAESLNGLYQALENFETSETKIRNLASIGGLSVFQLERRYRFIYEMRIIHKRIRGGIPGEMGDPGIYTLLRGIEQYFPKTIEEVRSTKKLVNDLVPKHKPDIDTRESKFPSLGGKLLSRVN
jgi:hypothetical protein